MEWGGKSGEKAVGDLMVALGGAQELRNSLRSAPHNSRSSLNASQSSKAISRRFGRRWSSKHRVDLHISRRFGTRPTRTTRTETIPREEKAKKVEV
jgi:hypothetical protein